MGAITFTAEELWGDVPKSPHRNFVVNFYAVKWVNLSPLYTAKMYSKNYECVIMPVTKGTPEIHQKRLDPLRSLQHSPDP